MRHRTSPESDSLIAERPLGTGRHDGWGAIMVRRIILSITCALALACGGATAAWADTADDDGYQPVSPSDATLAGSVVSPACVADAPWIDYSVTLTDPDHVATGHTAYLDITDGSNVVTLTLGEVASDGTITGRVLWPGASVDASGKGNGWPGWTLSGGTWVPTDGNYAWTRGEITGLIRVNPELEVAMSYPPSTPNCLTGPRTQTDDGAVASVTTTSGGLPATGGDGAALLWPAIGGIVLIGAGATLAARRARAKTSHR